jgi:hypothetical protein
MEDDALLGVISMKHVGCGWIDAPTLVGWTVIADTIGVTGPGPCTGFMSRTATITTTTTIRMPMTIYRVRGFFAARTFRQFGQALRFGSTGAPQEGQVFCAIYLSSPPEVIYRHLS